MDDVLNKIDQILSGKYSDWISGFFFFVLPLVLGLIGKLASGNAWAGVSIGLFVFALFLGVTILRQRSRIKDLVALKSGEDFQIVRFDNLDPHLTPVMHPELPKGLIWLRWVKFFIAHQQDDNGSAAKVIFVRPTSQNEASLVDIPVDIDRVSEVYLLITTGYGVKSFQGALPGDGWDEKLAGHIEFIFGDSSKQEFQLRLGHNIREFTFGNQPWAIDALRKEGSTSFQVWHSSQKECTLDMLFIKVEGQPKMLDKIRIVAQMEKGAKPIALQDNGKVIHEPAYPAIHVFAITCRTRKK
jgi:hypothetical protein